MRHPPTPDYIGELALIEMSRMQRETLPLILKHDNVERLALKTATARLQPQTTVPRDQTD